MYSFRKVHNGQVPPVRFRPYSSLGNGVGYPMGGYRLLNTLGK